MTSNAITSIIPAQQVQRLKAQLETVKVIRREVLAENIDFGVIPGTNKPTLLKPGAEKILNVLRLRPKYEVLDKEMNMETGFILYRYRCVVMEIDTGLEIGESIGSCNSFEKKYRYRWIPEHEVPSNFNLDELVSRTSAVEEFDFAVTKAETTGKYGKPASYWQKFTDAIASGQAQAFQKSTNSGKQFKAWRIETTVYQVPNPEVWDQLNTIDKMAQKRALVSAVLQAANVSDYFTVDIEDMPDFSEAYNSTIEVVSPDDVDEAREKVIEKLSGVEEANVVEEDDRTVQFPEDDGPKQKVHKNQSRRLSNDDNKKESKPQHWAADKKKRLAFMDRAIQLGMGEDVGSAWDYLVKHWPDGKLTSGSDLPHDMQEAYRVLKKMGDALKDEVGATDGYWTKDLQGKLTKLVKLTFDRSVTAFEADGPLIDEPHILAALKRCAEIVQTKGWAFRTREIEYTKYGNAKVMVFHTPEVGGTRYVPVNEADRPSPAVAYGGRSNLKKELGTETYDALGIGDWKEGNTYTLPDGVWLTFEINQKYTNDGTLYFVAENVGSVGTMPNSDDDATEVETIPTEDEIPF